MAVRRNLSKVVEKFFQSLQDDQRFLQDLQWFVGIVSRLLALIMIVVILVMLVDLVIFLWKMMFTGTSFLLGTVTEVFGAFLSILIAIELLENITAYLKEHTIQIKLVIVTSLIAVARKIILLDFEKVSGVDLIGLGLSIAALSLSYWIVHTTQQPNRGSPNNPLLPRDPEGVSGEERG
ncbi:MAG: phosphate-starvation-inducible PsiE family protein [Cyanobacteriota bacterium]|nr:phosphate-starvation-inducible PsiE family protein [Cyanobacteriota bacterium]